MVLVLSLSGLVPSAVNTNDEDDLDDEGRRRLQKRRKAVAEIKLTPEYTNALQHDPSERPTTPIPSLSFSKRGWEKVAMDWRQALKDMPPAAAFSSSSSDCTTSIECSSVSDI